MHIETRTKNAVKYAGNRSKLAKLLGITRQAISAWDFYLPQTSAQKLYILTNGLVGDKVDAPQ